jgi:hypothetical protein
LYNGRINRSVNTVLRTEAFTNIWKSSGGAGFDREKDSGYRKKEIGLSKFG